MLTAPEPSRIMRAEAAVAASPNDACPRWLPAAPLIELLDAHCLARSLRALVRSSGIDRRTFERVRHRQRIRSDSADRIAVALGRHPSEIWPEWFPGAIR